jgi:hypothetical protein
MKETWRAIVVSLIAALGIEATAQPLSIYQIQYTTDPAGASPYDGSIVDCNGGIVVQKRPPGKPAKLTLYDPSHPDAWGGIMAKDPQSADVFNDINVGDWVSFKNFKVEESSGTTFLQYYQVNDPCYTIVSRNNPLPKPVTVHVGQIKAPVEGYLQWVVEDHSAEKYEAMLLRVVDVNVGGMDLGKAKDNYILQSNRDPNSCWASDYMNEVQTPEGYNPLVQTNQRFCGVIGVLEQYTGTKSGVYYDYYQLLTRYTEDFIVKQKGDLDDDCGVDFFDYSGFAVRWSDTGCGSPGFCGGADITEDGVVDANDLREFAENWLEGVL